MEKKRYEVDVQAKQLTEVTNGKARGLVITASQQEADMLELKFTELGKYEFDSYVRAHIPIMPYSNDVSNDRYNETLRDIYENIYRLADQETKDRMMEEGILTEVKRMK
ncbi:hypothetical protein [Pseudogracilibacillus sp. SO10305]|uniref:hypothetical protein n=1 Tax=Pseudogracilibacillus sp. SO10305 TaxID=3098292 RepID=UPI00300E1AF0